ncbi:uncharacterized protein rusc1 isoform X2 [Synchiropus splendidus]|uniref:uncharacterized protein rusc1 isoform X2 n=1 Tax=Synchiropus splendidus TaxID=270530 RepID=UPI00237E049D|nr:uncharacterized protein rusc1 isoform X2 [Synchiropus splendidus]
MQSAQSQKPKRFDVSRRTTAVAARKPYGLKEDKNMNTIPSSSPRRLTKGPTAAPRTRVPVQPRAPVGQSRFGAQKQASSVKSFKPKPKSTRAAVVAPVAPAPAPPPLPSSLPLDPNCNEPSLPCLCCDGRSPQDNNSMFNHNHNNNNTISLRQQMQLPPPPPVLPQRQEVTGTKKQLPSREQGPIEAAVCPALLGNDQENVARSSEVTKKDLEDDEEESSGDIDIDVDEDDNDDDEDDDTLVPSCCDCPPSLLEFSLSSSSSSSSTSISSCSDLDSDSADPSESLCSSYCQDHLSITMSPKDDHFLHCTESRPPTRSPPSLPLNGNPFLTSQSAVSSPDEGYPSALDSPSPDYLGVKESEVASLGLLDFLESVGEFGKMERFSQVIQVARWDLEGEQHWDVLRDRLDHLDRLEKVNREVKLYYIAKLHEKGYDLGDLDEQDLSDVLDEMGNIDIPLKLYKNRVASMADSQEFSDAGVDLTAPSDSEDPLAPDSLTPSPVEPPSRPPKPPVRHASVNSDLHTYINISRETVSMAVTTSPTLTTFSLNSSSPTFSTFRCEKSLPPSPPSIPPLPSSKPIQYLSLYTTSSPPPSIPTPTPPIPPPRKRHLARKEAQRLAALQAEQEKTPVSLPPPTTSPPPLPPPPVISVSCSSSPPAIPPPPALPPPPSFHALDVEIRKLLMLAGLTQADLLKLSPELGVCVTGLEEEADEDNQFSTCSSEQYSFRLKDEVAEESDSEFSIGDGWSKQLTDQSAEIPVDPRGGKVFSESKDTQRKTSFTEIARRRKRNSGVTTDLYYTTGTSNTYETKETFNYPSTPPPPPPPRPLPPIPPSVPALKVSTLSANSARPERFDWLIAFTPEADSQPETTQPKICDITKPDEESVKTNTSSGSSAGSAPRVTTFKELRNRNKSAPPPTKVITDPEPDPTIITPDPDILYNLKWRREKAGSDGSQWEYTSQAQALFMQPPPALTSMAALKEMLQRADQEGGQAELYPSLKIGYPVNDSRFLTTDREREELKEERGKVKDKLIVEERGRADGRRTTESQTTAVHSVSFTGAAQKDEPSWMGEEPMRGLSSVSLREKKALVSAVSQAVEAILAQFSSSRTVVQKALSGDSAVNPSLGRLVLQCLCPALHRLLTDGLKPHQSDLIAGRRPNSAWGLVQASTRPGLKTQALYNLQNRVGELPQLRQSKHKFNAFIFGLLNAKLLDFWLSHLQTCIDVLDTFYYPSSFMLLSLTACQHVYQELLLVLQPLSLLTFNLDLLFQHHHLETHSPQIPSPPSSGAGVQQPARKLHPRPSESRYFESLSGVDFGNPEKQDGLNSGKSSSGVSADWCTETSPQLMWVQEKRIADLPPPNMEEDSLAQQAGQVIQQGWGAMMRWGGRLSQNLTELSLSAARKEDMKTDLSELPDQAVSDFAPLNSSAQVPWGLGRLFGASRCHSAPSRRPSQWLAPGVTALTRIMSSSSTPAPRNKDSVPLENVKPVTDSKINNVVMDTTRPLRSVRMLCDHKGSGAELSFSKGEELVVLGGIDQDWIRCRQGDKEGMVQIGYTSIIM